jgi:ATP synthase protein I
MTTPSRWDHHGPEVDPWSAMSMVISGVLLWGAIGYGVSEWLDSRVYMGVGVVLGGVLGVWLVYLRYGRAQSGPPATVGPVVLPGQGETSRPAGSAARPVAPTLAPPTDRPRNDRLRTTPLAQEDTP